MIIKVHGANGAGKSALVRAAIARYALKPVTDGGKIVRYQNVGPTVVVLGSYRNACGGMDGVSKQEDRERMIKPWMGKRVFVFFEGILASTTYGALGAMSQKDPHPWAYVFLDTPPEVCIQRILQRRKENGNDKPFDPNRALMPKFRAIESVKRRATELHHHVYTLSYKDSPEKQLTKLMKELRK